MKKHWYLIYLFFCVYLLVSIPANTEAAQTSELPEIHLLIDVSASMKKTDPLNLRVNAIKMFNYLANQKAKMNLGVFSTDYKEIIPLQLATPHYSSLFKKKVQEIRSDGHFTDINHALNAANQSWGKGKKIIILLTDGKLDLGSEKLNSQSTQQLNEITIPKLQHDQVQVYTIGLSDQSDKLLLSNLSLKTNALSQIVLSANDLDGILYSTFTAAINADGATVHKNKDSSRSIKIDPSIHEFTLIFKKNTVVNKLYLIAPDGVKRSLDEANTGMLATKNYEIIKMSDPLPGEWVLSGPEQQMERVLILTDVGLGTNFATGIYFNGELLSLTGYLEQGMKPISSDMAVDGMQMKFELKNGDNKFSYVLPHDTQGLFNNEFILDVPSGTYKATLSSQNTYLSREHQYMVDVQDTPFSQAINKEHDAVLIRLLRPDLIKTETVDIRFSYKNIMKNIPITNTEPGWVADLSSLCVKHAFSEEDILINIHALSTNRRNLLFKLSLNGKVCSPDYKPLAIAQSIPPKEKAAPNAAPLSKEKTLKKEQPTKFYSLFLISILLLISVVFAAVVLLGIQSRKRINKIREEL